MSGLIIIYLALFSSYSIDCSLSVTQKWTLMTLLPDMCDMNNSCDDIDNEALPACIDSWAIGDNQFHTDSTSIGIRKPNFRKSL